jgi:hypothetical protein
MDDIKCSSKNIAPSFAVEVCQVWLTFSTSEPTSDSITLGFSPWRDRGMSVGRGECGRQTG